MKLYERDESLLSSKLQSFKNKEEHDLLNVIHDYKERNGIDITFDLLKKISNLDINSYYNLLKANVIDERYSINIYANYDERYRGVIITRYTGQHVIAYLNDMEFEYCYNSDVKLINSCLSDVIFNLDDNVFDLIGEIASFLELRHRLYNYREIFEKYVSYFPLIERQLAYIIQDNNHSKLFGNSNKYHLIIDTITDYLDLGLEFNPSENFMKEYTKLKLKVI
jgi:hypothetical protein